MALRPLQDRLLVKRLEEKEQVPGGIIIPDTRRKRTVRPSPARPRRSSSFPASA